MIINAVCYIATLLSQIAAIYVFGKLSAHKINFSKYSIIIILLMSLLQMILNLYNYALIGTIFTITYFYIMFKHLYKCSKIEAQNYSIIIWTLSLLVDLLIMAIVNLFGLMTFYEANPLLSKAIGTIVMSFFLTGIGNIKPIVKSLNKFYQKMHKLNLTFKHFIGLIILFLLIGVLSSKNIENQFMVFFALVVGIFLINIVVCFISLLYQLLTLKLTNEILEKNNEANRRIINHYRVLKHNLVSKLMGVKTVANKDSKELLDNIIMEYNSSFYVRHDINTMPTGINGLVFEILYKYKNDDLEISIDNKIKSKILETIGARNYNFFCEALGITLDNALQASKKSKDKIIYLRFSETEDKIILKIMNTFSGKIDLDELGTMYYTSKSKGHGLGLFSLIGRKNLSLTTSIKNNLFINVIEVKKIKK